MTTPEKITIHAVVDAPIETAWEKYTDPDHITQWNFASDDWCCPSASNEMEIGGTYTARMEAKDKSFGFEFVATYTDLTPGKSFTYVMEDGRAVTTSFEAIGNNKTEVTTVFDAETENDVEMQRVGWQSILNNFKKHAEAA
ncbi:SRPBCC domain-containing protein [Maritimibacter dapengensis]|uniref:SRPBCC domain-containing protein n=1 Tax=Maritimibacter dapengensis TaxID=2836868 RepID=A0ABS6T7R2_9RHOB|nr:SRPBCC domain-containing protein [Maritimibacter dapengensis]MBV7380521.1 SRPBCC domain-containing protein [Maritimibacter dapengensis]